MTLITEDIKQWEAAAHNIDEALPSILESDREAWRIQGEADRLRERGLQVRRPVPSYPITGARLPGRKRQASQ